MLNKYVKTRRLVWILRIPLVCLEFSSMDTSYVQHIPLLSHRIRMFIGTHTQFDSKKKNMLIQVQSSI